MKGAGWLTAVLLLVAVAACDPGPETDLGTRPVWPGSVAGKPGNESSLLGPPEYHLPLDWWRDHHSLLVARKHERRERFFSQGECLACHAPSQSCRVCHRYVGISDVERE